jgi:hypothetical protein
MYIKIGNESMMTKRELIGCIGGMILLISVCFGAYFALQKQLTPMYMHSALADEVKQVQGDVKQTQKDLDFHKKDSYLKSIRQRIWTIKERAGEKPKNITIKEELDNLEVERKRLEEELKDKSK